MKEKYKIFIENIKERFAVRAAAVVVSTLLALGFWGIAFPQYLFTGDCVRILNEEGEDVTRETGEGKNLYCEIGNAEPEQIEIRISILEWAKR